MTENFLSDKMKYTSEFALNFDERIIHIFGELDSDIGTSLRVKFELIQQWYLKVEEKPITDITLDISSAGGDIYAIYGALDFFHELKGKGILVNTRAHGICMSAATIVLAGGTGVRSSFPNCRFMLHDVHTEGVGGTANQIKHITQTIVDEQTELFEMYAKFARKGQEPLTDRELKREAKKWHKTYAKDGLDHYITANEILKLNLIDQII